SAADDVDAHSLGGAAGQAETDRSLSFVAMSEKPTHEGHRARLREKFHSGAAALRSAPSFKMAGARSGAEALMSSGPEIGENTSDLSNKQITPLKATRPY